MAILNPPEEPDSEKMKKKSSGFILVRAAEKADAPVIRRIMTESFEKYRRDAGIRGSLDALKETLEDIEADILGDMRGKHVFLALYGGEPAGSVRVAIDSEAGEAYISRLGVCGAYSRQGIGKALLRAVDNLLDSRGIQRVSLHTAVANKALMAFYHSLGFRVGDIGYDRGYARARLIRESGAKTEEHGGTGVRHGIHRPMRGV